MNQVEKLLVNRLEELTDLESHYEHQIHEGDFNIAYKNMFWAASSYFDAALIRWRRGESPVADFEAVLSLGERLQQGEAEWSLDQLTLAGNSFEWTIIGYAAYLLGQPEPLSGAQMETIRSRQVSLHPSDRAADVLLEFKIIDALAGRPWRDGFEDLITRLGSKKRQTLAAHTFRTYLDLLDAKGQSDHEIEPLVREAEVNYDKRRRDAFYGGGPAYMGGTDYNPYVVDFTLAAILKHLDWKGDSIHKWRW